MGGNSKVPSSGINGKVARACERCRRQKLKCDTQRPCTLCIRAGVNCVSGQDNRWKAYQPQRSSEAPTPRRSRNRGPRLAARNSAQATYTPSFHSEQNEISPRAFGQGADNHGPLTSSSTMSLVDGAFQLHNMSSVEETPTNAIPGGRQQETPSDGGTNEEITGAGHPRRRPLVYTKSSATAEITSLFPTVEVASLLVDTYFDRAHWFVLVFHQDEFRQRWPRLYQQNSDIKTSRGVGFTSTFIMVMIIGLQHAGDYRLKLLEAHGVSAESLKEHMLSTVKSKLLDIVSLGSLEAVQACILLGTYYLFHGAQRLAWPVCGCGLRIAQSLNLHRRMQPGEISSLDAVAFRRQNETRKRCWWAIYEIETFCSMSYGYPHGILDTDCDLEPLDPSAKSRFAQSFDEHLECETTLLSYKYFMSKLSIVTRSILHELYGLGSASLADERLDRLPFNLRSTVRKVVGLDGRLQKWRSGIPSELRWENVAGGNNYESLEDVDRDIGASGPRFEKHIYQLQALSLRLAYENARILVHRPLLSYRPATGCAQQHELAPQPNLSDTDPFAMASQKCREAALNIAEIALSPIVDLVSGTYAAAFVSMHTFTAGVTLSILGSTNPLGLQSVEVKSGLHRLMVIHEKLRSGSILAAQALKILQRLSTLVIEKELNMILDLSNANLTVKNNDSERAATSNYYAGGSNLYSTLTATTPKPHVGLNRQDLTSADTPNIEPSASAAAITEGGFDYVEDPTLSEALYDIDQALSTYASESQGMTTNEFNDFRLQGDEGFPILDQTWIWGLDNLISSD